MDTEPTCAHTEDDGEDCESECVDCDERERLAMSDCPPVTVLTGNTYVVLIIAV